jgi:GNAT superfamily N-acetyltransferase
MYLTVIAAALADSSVRTLSQQEELPLLRDHLLRLDRISRRDRFHGFMDDSFIERYAEKCANDGTVIIAFFEDGVVRGAAELHPPDQSPDSLPEIAFSVESSVRRRGVGSILFRKLIKEARARGYKSLRKFGAQLVFRHGESTGTIDVTKHDQAEFATSWAESTVNAFRAAVAFNRAYWRMLFRVAGAPTKRGAS